MMEKCKEYLKNNFSNGPKAKKILAIATPLFVISVMSICVVANARKTVTINVDGNEQTFVTYKRTIKGVLKQAGVKLGSKDKVEPALGKKLVKDEVIEVRKAAKVGIVMGSDSDLEVMSKAAEMLEKFGIDYELTVISAHRMPDVFFDYAKTAEEKGFKVIIAGAGGAAHLPGMCAAIFPMPVIGIPMHTTSLGGRDSLYSIVQMPTGIPVATVAINGGANAGILAAKILATSDAALLERLKDYTKNLKESVQKKDARLQEVGYKNY